MPRGYIPISRADDVEEQGELSPWLKNVADQLAKQQQSVVEKSRRRANMINQVNNILKNPPRYATVDDAVQDMRERTGLNSYLKNISANVKTASVETRDEDGWLTEGAAKLIVAQITSKKKLLSKANFLGLAPGAEIPEVLKQYGDNAVEDIIYFVKNNIENSPLSASIPQISHDILHILGPKYKLSADDVMNHDVSKFISAFIMEAKSKLSPMEKNPNLGAGVGKNISDDNEDYWAGMMPKS